MDYRLNCLIGRIWLVDLLSGDWGLCVATVFSKSHGNSKVGSFLIFEEKWAYIADMQKNATTHPLVVDA